MCFCQCTIIKISPDNFVCLCTVLDSLNLSLNGIYAVWEWLVYAFNPSTWEAERHGSLMIEAGVVYIRTCLKEQKMYISAQMKK